MMLSSAFLRILLFFFVVVPFLRPTAIAKGGETGTCEAPDADGTSRPSETAIDADDADADRTDGAAAAAAAPDEDPCRNFHPSCPTFAALGECGKNPGFMRTNCALSCGVCVPSNHPAAEDVPPENVGEPVDPDRCRDKHELCPDWADAGECVINPTYMRSACVESCWLCVDVDALRSKRISEGEIRKRRIFVSSDWGKPQLFEGSDAELALLRPVLRSMDAYARNDITSRPPSVVVRCHNDYEHCAFWASQDQCVSNVNFMVQNCPLACRNCDRAVELDRCAGKRRPDARAAFRNGKDAADMFERIRSFEEYGPEFLSRPGGGTTDDDKKDGDDAPYLVRFDTFLTSKECDDLVALGDTIGWSRSTMDEEEAKAGNPAGKLPQRRSVSAICDVDGRCDADETYRRVVDRISKVTGVPPSHFEPMDMVKYDVRGSSYGVHHDARLHDSWRPSGPRALSMYLSLSDVEEGGSTGFPSLDWTFVTPKKGQALLWSNVRLDRGDDLTKSDPRMVHEGLPIVRGAKVGANVRMRLYDWRDAYDRDCV